MTQPHQLESPLYRLLRNEDITTFNSQRISYPSVDMREGDFRGLDLRNVDAKGVDFRDAYFRGADLRGVDLRNALLEGASLAHAQISGTFFPFELDPDEILMSVNFGTRLRYRVTR